MDFYRRTREKTQFIWKSEDGFLLPVLLVLSTLIPSKIGKTSNHDFPFLIEKEKWRENKCTKTFPTFLPSKMSTNVLGGFATSK
jgi:hypothetical protein